MKKKGKIIMSKIKKIIKKFTGFINNTKERVITAVMLLFLFANRVFADDIASSKLAKGTEKLLTDATNWLLVLTPIVTVVAVIYFLIRRGISDDMDHRKWNSRITGAVVCGIGVIVADITIKLIVSYFE
jgi:Na+/H+ antiporter NhaA